MTSIKLSNVILPAFKECHKVIKAGRYLKHVFKGGRGSGKSSHIAIEMVLDIIKYPITGLCVRRVGNTLQESCYEQIKEAISILGLDNKFKLNLNPLRITYLPRGNTIIFRGADDPAKIKSIKVSKFPIARMWIEELAEFKVEEDVDIIEKSILRAKLSKGIKYKFYYSYNPPKRKQSWVNKKYETQFLPNNIYVHHSTYLDNTYISEEFIEEAKEVKTKNINKYDWEYMGKPIGAGVVPFGNLVFRKITDEEIHYMDNIRQGIDWGYATDPFHFGRWHYDKTRRTIYAIAEIQQVKLSNREASEKIIYQGFNDLEMICDSAEPKSIAELQTYGLKAYGAKKGPGSIEHGEKWLDDLDAIVIDPERTPKTAVEFENIDYQINRDGNVVPWLEDKDNHSIDCCRYAFDNDMTQNKTVVRKFKGGV